MLIGFEYAGFHPEKEQSVEHLLLMSNKFGKCIGGTHSTIVEKTQLLLQEVQIAYVSVKIDDFYSTEALGVSCNPRCGGCKCNECPIGGKQYTLKEERIGNDRTGPIIRERQMDITLSMEEEC